MNVINDVVDVVANSQTKKHRRIGAGGKENGADAERGCFDGAGAAQIAAGFQEAALRPDYWPLILADSARVLGAEGAFVVSNMPNGGSHESSERMRAFVASCLAEESFTSSSWLARKAREGQIDEPITEWMAFSPDEVKQEPFFRDLAARHGLAHFLAAALQDIDEPFFFVACRSAAQGPFEADEVESFRGVMPALRQSVRLAERIAAARDAGAEDLVKHLTRPALLVDSRGTILGMNAAAKGFFGNAVAMEAGQLVSRHAGATAELRKRLSQLRPAALRAESGESSDPIGTFVLLPREATRPVLADIVPLDGASHDLFRRARALLLLTDPDFTYSVDEAVCREMFRLSPAETRLAIAIGRGEDLNTFARAAGLAVETVRKRVKTVLGKTGTRRQAELTALLGRLRRDLAPASANANATGMDTDRLAS